MRIGIAGLSHETNTFAAERNDTMASVNLLRGQEILDKAHPRSFIGGFVEAAGQGADVTLLPTVTVRYTNGGTISAEIYERCRDAIVEGLRAARPLDAVYLAMHGAMVAEPPYLDAEGELVRAIRKALGDLPIVATYDFHAIMSDYELTNVVPFPNNTNPHIDGYERGLEAGENILKILAGELHPVTRWVRVPIIGPNIGQSTWSHIPEQEQRLLLYQLNERRAELEKTPGVVNITILGGYGYGDSPDESMAIVATADGDAALAQRLAEELGRELWARREALRQVRPIYPIDEGIRMAMSRKAKPVLLVDLGDDPGSACPADSPAVLERLIALNAHDCALAIRDAEAVEAGMRAGVGAEITLPVGAKADQRFYQPVVVTGRVHSIDDGEYMILGPTHGGWGRDVAEAAFREAHVGPRVVLRIGNKIDVVLFTEVQGNIGKERDFFKSAGIILEEKQILVVKSNQAHRASFDPVVASTIELNTPGVSTVDYATLPYEHLRRPMWPIDPDMAWSV